jgi:hypothetical protein
MSFSNEFDDFVRGQQDCRDGIEHKSGQSDKYDAGYSHEYQAEQILNHQSEKQNEY